MKRFEEIKPISREHALEVLASGDAQEISDALTSIAYHETNWKWAQEIFLNFLGSSDSDIAALSATCLGHLARIHGNLDKERVVSALSKHLKNSEIRGRIEDALEDIQMFVSN